MSRLMQLLKVFVAMKWKSNKKKTDLIPCPLESATGRGW